MLVVGLLGLSSCASYDAKSLARGEGSVSVDQKFQEIMLVTEKLSFINESRAEVDALEKDGLSHIEANRMRLAMEQKKRQLMHKTTSLISAL